MKTSTNGLIALMGREAIVLSTYKDSVGVLTLGVGHTAAAGEPKPISGLTITLADALDIFSRDIVKYEDRVNDAVEVSMAQHEFDALVSFDFNTGGIYRAKLTEALNDGDQAGAVAGFMGWLKPPEIKGRREAEQKLFATGDYGDLSTVLVYDKFPGTARRVSTEGLLEAAEKPTEAPPPVPAPSPALTLEQRVAACEQRLAALERNVGGLESRLGAY